MNPLYAAAAIVALVALATVVGLVYRRRNGAVRLSSASTSTETVTPADVESSTAFGSRATLLQFSTEFCAYCPATRRLLGGIADRTPGVVHVDVDLTHAPEIAQRFKVLQTPTTLLLDGSGTVRARIGGAPRPAELAEHLDRIIGSNHVAA